MIHIAVVEDDRREHTQLVSQIGEIAAALGEEIAISSFYTSDSLLETDITRYGLIFLDIQTPGMDGMTAAQYIRSRSRDVLLIFVTSMVQYALQGYRVEALDFLAKPVDRALLETSLTRSLGRLKIAEPAYLNVKSGSSHLHLAVRDIAYAEAQGRRVLLHTADEIHPWPGTLGALENELKTHGFFRCHSAFLVNLEQVERIEGSDARVAGTPIPVSKHRRKAFLSTLAEHWGNTL